jgi:hypothetical protein
MAVSIRVANIKLTHVNALGNAVDKDAVGTTLETIRVSASQEHRVIPNGTGAAESPNSGGFPTVPAYLDAEAADDHALAYMDQYTIITQMIT